ncbi:MAG: copper chaperone Copz family protein [Anaerolineales bacterium]
MTDACCCPPEAGNAVCEWPAQNFERPSRTANACPQCGKTARPMQGQTVKALLSVSLREVREVDYLFCRTRTCPVVYFSPGDGQIFTVEQVRERVYQKEPEAEAVWVCYCFRYTVGDVRAASPKIRAAILNDINTGINTGQCACDLRNPQGSCCLGNVRGLIQQLGA